ncbi:Eco57I restriction-modification methylase domain-containing protein [Noviherbaspirillum pedocola]|uniref:site-specific DNA-methyltransferase (adenine-specific) n=1 Tax=Noviherbaspirillum pedocola TaxID=2801341 RepID=A0A934W7X1_9BURK|nr:N-6 DNA methylase [Noviherbaspirillum pedocola]MBK4736123.1 SAM-dependent methyltransferase [Noviherbaspirillum pedocola]
MPTTSDTYSLFAEDGAHAAQCEAIDRLHAATAIYTCEPVVNELLSRLNWPNGTARLLDSSCGDGAFLAAALAKALALHAYDDETLANIVEGWEIHPFACAQARARIEATFVAHGRSAAAAQRLAQHIVVNRDFLAAGPISPMADLIVGNLPYLRWLKVPELLRTQYEALVPRYAAGDLLHSFLDRCVTCLRDGGEIALVTSDRWLYGASTAQLREAVGKRLAIRHMQRLEPSSAFYYPKQRRVGTAPRVHPVALVLGAAGSGRALSRRAIYPGVDATRYAGMPMLGDLATVRLAPWLGRPGRFVVNAAQAAHSGLPREVLVPVFDVDDIADYTLAEPDRFAVLTRPDEIPCAEVLAHLQRNPAPQKRARRGTPWLAPESFHNFRLDKPSLFVSRIARTPRPTSIPAGYLPMNHHLSVVCDDDAMLERVKAALSGEMAAEWLREHAAPLEGGYFEIKAPLLRTMPIDIDVRG